MSDYTILDHDRITTGMTAIDAADVLLSEDGHEYDVRRDESGGWNLYVSEFSRNSTLGGKPLTRSVVYSLLDDEQAAREEIAERVIRSGRWERGNLHCMTDEAYAEMARQLAADEQEG